MQMTRAQYKGGDAALRRAAAGACLVVYCEIEHGRKQVRGRQLRLSGLETSAWPQSILPVRRGIFGAKTAEEES